MSTWRISLLAIFFLAMPGALVWHLAGLQVLPGQAQGFTFLQRQGEARTLRKEKINAYRGMIKDRNGELLAVSTPVVSLIANPQRFDWEDLPLLAKTLSVSEKRLRAKFLRFENKQFLYLARQLPPHKADEVLAFGIEGVRGVEEFQRYYPAGEVAAHVVGFTDIDDSGQEGMELSLDSWLSGEEGFKKVIKNLKGHTVRDLGLVKSASPGKNIQLSIDMRLQYLAYRELKAAVKSLKAISGSAIVLDVETGEVLAMVNQPSYNPNDRRKLTPSKLRNRAITDLLEPGSTVKPFTVIAALETNRYTPETTVNTNPGYIKVGRKTLLDPKNYGVIDLTTIIQKSSQVGISKLALDLEPFHLRDLFQRVGFGQDTGVGFPGEGVGVLPNKPKPSPIERAALAFGHGLSVTPLQLAQAYLSIASLGMAKPISLLKLDQAPASERIFDEKIASQIINMLESVTGVGGTAARASIDVYSTAGKTGTAHKVGKEGYADDRYMALFAGLAPVDDPKIVSVVVINEPRTGQYYGGEAAAPVFAKIAEGSLRALSVRPKNIKRVAVQ